MPPSLCNHDQSVLFWVTDVECVGCAEVMPLPSACLPTKRCCLYSRGELILCGEIFFYLILPKYLNLWHYENILVR